MEKYLRRSRKHATWKQVGEDIESGESPALTKDGRSTCHDRHHPVFLSFNYAWSVEEW